MATPTAVDNATTNPGGTGSTLTATLPTTQAVGDVIYIWITNSGNALWATNPTGWSRKDQRTVGTASNGLVSTLLFRRLVSGDTLPLSNPLCNLGATVTRSAVAWTERGADVEGVHLLPEWGAAGHNTGTSNPIRPPAVTTPDPEMHVVHLYGARAATNAPEPSGYSQVNEVVISGTLVSNVSEKTVANQQTALSSQDASPTSGARWVAGILCIPSPDYVHYRSGSQALNANGLNATPALPTGASSNDNAGRKDLIISTVEVAGTPTIAPNTPADWTEIGGEWSSTTSGNGTTVRKYWTHYDGTLDRQFNRSTSGEIFVYFSVYRNTDQSDPIGAFESQQNASGTSSAYPSTVRTETKSTIQITCVADATPAYTTPAGFIERNDSNGIVCADQVFNAIATLGPASFTLSTASPSLCGTLEILSVVGVAPPVDLTVGDSSHAHSVANVALTQSHELIVAGGVHPHTAESPELSQVEAIGAKPSCYRRFRGDGDLSVAVD